MDDTAGSPDAAADHVLADGSVPPDGYTPDDGSADADGGATDAPTTNADAPTDAPVDQASTSCAIVDTSTLPHVHIQFPTPVCAFTVAQAQAGIAIPYEVVVDQDVPGFAPAPPYDHPYASNEVANLALTAVLSGGSQRYCVCDTGLPQPSCPTGDGGYTADYGQGATDACAPVTIPQGTYSFTFTWDGRNWNGPSDTSNEEGRLFPAGDYQLVVSTSPGSIGDSGAVQAIGKMTIHLSP